MNGLTPLGIAAIAYILLAVLGLIVVYSLLKRILLKIAKVWSLESLFGSDPKTRLISLGVVALLFPSIFLSLASAIMSLIGNFFVDVPKSLFNNWLANQSVCERAYTHMSMCLGQMGAGFVQAWTSALSDSLNRLAPGSISYSRLILMLAVWAGVTLFLSAPRPKDQADGAEQPTRLQAALKNLSPRAKRHIVFFGVLILAGYLSIAAIAAIPGLEETAVPSETVSLERLQQQLDQAFSDSQARIPQELQLSDPFATPVVPAGNAIASTTTPAEVTASFDLSSLRLRRGQLLALYPKLLEDFRTQATNAKASGISAYQASVLERKGTKQTVQHFLDIEAWYQRMLNRMEGQLTACRRSMGAADGLFQTLTSGNNSTYSNDLIQQVLPNVEQGVRDACQSSIVAEPVPQREDLGSNMGPFSYVASWLLRTESLPLAQIVGLLGFGLLGSAVSSLVRKEPGVHRHEFMPDELAAMIIRGATAAVVVFLAVKGGLAVFTAGESNPNSYALLLTCLIAAVYSEDVWRVAHDQFQRNLGGSEERTMHAKMTQTSVTVDEKTTKSTQDEGKDDSAQVQPTG